jgi:nucleotide-binding universal stress UspA family protein
MEVILVVPTRPERHNGLIMAAERLGTLIGGARVVDLSLRAVVGGPAQTEGPQSATVPAEVDLASEIEIRGARADFVVVAQPEAEDDKAAHLAFRAALFRTEQPVLMAPRSGVSATFGEAVAIAWRNDARTLRVLMPALRLLSNAREVHLLAGVRAGTPTPAIPAVLVEHGIRAALHVLAITSGRFGELLLSRARELGADMLIMGAHAYTPLRFMVLGGVTSYVVDHADIPVLLRN